MSHCNASIISLALGINEEQRAHAPSMYTYQGPSHGRNTMESTSSSWAIKWSNRMTSFIGHVTKIWHHQYWFTSFLCLGKIMAQIPTQHWLTHIEEISSLADHSTGVNRSWILANTMTVWLLTQIISLTACFLWHGSSFAGKHESCSDHSCACAFFIVTCRCKSIINYDLAADHSCVHAPCIYRHMLWDVWWGCKLGSEELLFCKWEFSGDSMIMENGNRFFQCAHVLMRLLHVWSLPALPLLFGNARQQASSLQVQMAQHLAMCQCITGVVGSVGTSDV